MKLKFTDKSVKSSKIYILVFILIIPLISAIFMIYNYIQDYSILKIDLIDSQYRIASEELRFGVDNKGKNARNITKVILKVSDIRIDYSTNIEILCDEKDDEVKIYICNSGWSDVKDVKINVPTDSQFFKDLRAPDKFSISIDVLKVGEIYELGSLTASDLQEKVNESAIKLCYKIQNTKEHILYGSAYIYDEIDDKIVFGSGKGGGTVLYPIYYLISPDNGKYEYNIPISYTCNPHSYEEVGFALSADKSCHVRYSIEFYSNKKCIYRSEEKTVYIKTNSIYGPPNYENEEIDPLFEWLK